MSWRDDREAVRRFLSFSRQEWLGVALSVLFFALILSFRQWGDVVFDVREGFRNLVIAFFVTGAGVMAHHLAQKIVAIKLGFAAEMKLWWYGLFGSLLIAVLSNGTWPLYFSAGVFVHHLPWQRVGRFRYHADLGDWAKVALSGPVANVLLAGVVKTVQLWLSPFDDALVDEVFTFNLVYAACSLLPFPPLDGSRIFYASRLLYVFALGAFLSYVALVVLLGVYSYVWSLVIGFGAMTAFYFLFERG